MESWPALKGRDDVRTLLRQYSLTVTMIAKMANNASIFESRAKSLAYRKDTL